jgi:hypothetical protein
LGRDDLRAADEALRGFEQRYRISSARFYELYSQGLLDDGQHRGGFVEWAGSGPRFDLRPLLLRRRLRRWPGWNPYCSHAAREVKRRGDLSSAVQFRS